MEHAPASTSTAARAGEGDLQRRIVSTIEQGIAKLPKREQLVLSLYYSDGLSLREVGSVLGISRTTAGNAKGRALTYLRDYVRESVPRRAPRSSRHGPYPNCSRA